MKTLLLVGVVLTFNICFIVADQASRLGPEERRTLLDDDDDDIFPTNLNHENFHSNTRHQAECARDHEDCSVKSCCDQCTLCSCDHSRQHCRCQGRSELALFLGLCNRRRGV